MYCPPSDLLSAYCSPSIVPLQVGSATVPFRPEWDRHRLTPRHTAYLRVAEGCDHKCTFCAIPGFRGKFRSKPWTQLLVSTYIQE
jgi:ribosomal protein S12 methylthiotransferase